MSKRKKNAERPSGGWIAACGVIEKILDRFGWPGALLLFVIFFIVRYATIEQKVAIIDLYVLGRGLKVEYPLVVFGAIALLAFFAQRFYYRRKIQLMEAEVKRVGQWKTEHQELAIGEPLHHSEDQEE